MNNIIGVIGGNGVAATNKLLQLIEEKLTKKGAFRDQHHPEMIVWQATQVPSRSLFLEGRGPSFVNDYIDIAQKLKSIGCTICCICCNTAHAFIDKIENDSGIKFINLIEEVVKTAKSTQKDTFEIFTSEGCFNSNIYQKCFKKYSPNTKIIFPDKNKQKLITEIICNLKTKLRFDKTNNNPLFMLDSLIKESKYPVILGCTDFSVLNPSGFEIDSLECLANKIISLTLDL